MKGLQVICWSLWAVELGFVLFRQTLSKGKEVSEVNKNINSISYAYIVYAVIHYESS